jgi:hypothetical protein
LASAKLLNYFFVTAGHKSSAKNPHYLLRDGNYAI